MSDKLTCKSCGQNKFHVYRTDKSKKSYYYFYFCWHCGKPLLSSRGTNYFLYTSGLREEDNN